MTDIYSVLTVVLSAVSVLAALVFVVELLGGMALAAVGRVGHGLRKKVTATKRRDGADPEASVKRGVASQHVRRNLLTELIVAASLTAVIAGVAMIAFLASRDKGPASAMRTVEQTAEGRGWPTHVEGVLEPAGEGMYFVEHGTFMGYAGEDGNVHIPPVFAIAGRFREGHAAVMAGMGWTFCDAEGQLMGGQLYDGVRPFSEGLAAVCVGHRWGYIDRHGGMVIEPRFSVASDFHNGFARVARRDRGVFFIDRRGDVAWLGDTLPADFAAEEP